MLVTPAELWILERPPDVTVAVAQPVAGHTDVLALDPRAGTRVSTDAGAAVVLGGSRRARGRLGIPPGDHHAWGASASGWTVETLGKQARLTIDGAITRRAVVGDGDRVVVAPGLVLSLRLRPELAALHDALMVEGWRNEAVPLHLDAARAAVAQRLGGDERDVALAVRHLVLRRHLWGTAPLPPLHAAVARGDLAEVKALLAAGHDPNGLNEDDRPPLWGVVHLTVPSSWHPDAAGIVGALRAAGADVACQGVGSMLEHEAARGVTCAGEAAEAHRLRDLLAPAATT
jgi:hypothetical protein